MNGKSINALQARLKLGISRQDILANDTEISEKDNQFAVEQPRASQRITALRQIQQL